MVLAKVKLNPLSFFPFEKHDDPYFYGHLAFLCMPSYIQKAKWKVIAGMLLIRNITLYWIVGISDEKDAIPDLPDSLKASFNE